MNYIMHEESNTMEKQGKWMQAGTCPFTSYSRILSAKQGRRIEKKASRDLFECFPLHEDKQHGRKKISKDLYVTTAAAAGAAAAAVTRGL